MLGSSRSFVRLAMYSFQAGGTMRQDFWYWENGTGDRWGPTDVQVGLATAQGYGENPDRERFVSGMLRFHGPESSLTTLYGRWSRTGSTVAITWSSGDREQWRLTWRDDLLWKLELVAATYLVGPLFLDPSLRRDWTAANVGWGFGGATDGFTAGRPLSDCKKRYRGLNSGGTRGGRPSRKSASPLRGTSCTSPNSSRLRQARSG